MALLYILAKTKMDFVAQSQRKSIQFEREPNITDSHSTKIAEGCLLNFKINKTATESTENTGC